MIEYSADRKSAIYDGYKFRQDPKTGYYLSSKKTDLGKRERLHCYVWRKHYGIIPKGYQVHHKDHNKSNNDISNLELLTVAEHRKRHFDEMSDSGKAERKEIMKNKALPKAIMWHKSEQGREWHKKKYLVDAEKLHQKCSFVCLACGNEYIAEITGNNKFCSNKCKSKYRRESGIDDEERICIRCGAFFTASKYSKTARCKKCRNRKNRNYRQRTSVQYGSR